MVKKQVIVIIILILLLAIPVIWYLASPLFINMTVDEDFPVVDNGINTGKDEVMLEVLYSGEFMDAETSTPMRVEQFNSGTFSKEISRAF